jgi:hypothetical protein
MYIDSSNNDFDLFEGMDLKEKLLINLELL